MFSCFEHIFCSVFTSSLSGSSLKTIFIVWGYDTNLLILKAASQISDKFAKKVHMNYAYLPVSRTPG